MLNPRKIKSGFKTVKVSNQGNKYVAHIWLYTDKINLQCEVKQKPKVLDIVSWRQPVLLKNTWPRAKFPEEKRETLSHFYEGVQSNRCTQCALPLLGSLCDKLLKSAHRWTTLHFCVWLDSR